MQMTGEDPNMEFHYSDYTVVVPFIYDGDQARTIHSLSVRDASLRFPGGLKGKMRSQ